MRSHLEKSGGQTLSSMSNRAIIELEATVDRLLPEIRVERRPAEALLEAQREWAEAVWNAAVARGPTGLSSAELGAGLRLAASPVFICGVHRSGTTLVRDLLDGHPELAVLPAEGSYLTSLHAKIERLPPRSKLDFMGREWIRRLANPINQAPYWVLGRTTSERSPYVEFGRLLQAWWHAVEAAGSIDPAFRPHVAVVLACASSTSDGQRPLTARRWVDKTPTNEFHLERLFEAFPGARVLHVIRHPLAVYASRSKIEERTFGSFTARRGVLRELSRSMRIAARHQSGNRSKNHLLVRYEDLTADVPGAMSRVASFLGIGIDAALVRTSVANRPALSNSSFGAAGPDGEVRAKIERDYGFLGSPERDLPAVFAGRCARTLGYRIQVPPFGVRHFLAARFYVQEFFRSAVRRMRRVL